MWKALSAAVMVACCASGQWRLTASPQRGAMTNRRSEPDYGRAHCGGRTIATQGASHPLGIVITPGMPAYPPRFTQLQVLQPEHPTAKPRTPLAGKHSE